MVAKAMLGAVGDRGLLGGEGEANLRVRIARSVPSGQWVRTQRLLALELELPAAGIGFAGLGRLALELGNAGDGHEAQVAKCSGGIKTGPAWS